MNLFISPHNDDETLFGAFTLMREKPLVVIVTDGFIQFKRGDNITYLQRRRETEAAMKVLGCSVIFLGIRDDSINELKIKDALKNFVNFDKIYIPAEQGGNPQHDMISRVGRELWPNAIQYTTYTKTELHTTGNVEIKPTTEEMFLKDGALRCYKSQIDLLATRPHFTAVMGKSEFYA